MNVYVITGTSRGLGKALVNEVIQTQSQPLIYCLSRSVSDEIMTLAAEKEVDLDYITYDLSDLHGISEIMEDIMGEVEEQIDDIDAIYLINNAGVVAPVKSIDHCDVDPLINNVHVNLIAPMILTSSFIHHTKKWHKEKRILNISSGAAKHGYYGWSAYCASKAGLNLFTETVGIEQSYQEQGVKVMSLAPGIVDTEMQGELRKSTQEDFKDVDRFIAFHENGDLVHPEVVAKDIVKLLHNSKYENGVNLDIRHMEDYLNEG